MGISIGSILLSLFTLLAVLVILFIFRQSDRNSRTLDSMRRYYEKKCRELDEIVDEKKMELEDIKLSMETSERNAKSLFASFNDSLNMVKKRDDELNAMNSQIDACRNSFNEMADASQKADKNLKLLNQESRRVEGVRRTIVDLDQKLNDIKTNSETIIEDINRKNDDAFEALRVKALNSVNLQMGSLETGLEQAGKKLETFNAQIEELTGRQQLVSENAVKDLENTMSKRLGYFEDEVEKFGRSYMDRLDLLKDKNTAVESELFAQLDKESRGRLDIVRGEIDKEFETYKGTVSERLSEVESLKQDIISLNETFNQINREIAEVKDVVANIGTLETKLSDTEGRIAKIDKVMEWLAKTETRLNETIRKGEDAISVLGDLVEKPVDVPVPEATVNLDDKKETVKQLIQRGWSNEKISETLKISESEVELIRDFI